MSTPQHPLLASEVIAASGVDPAPTDSDLRMECPDCHRDQALSEATLVPAQDPQDITVYRCVNGCRALLATGHPNPVPLPGSGRYRLGDLALAPFADTGLLITMPSGQQVRLTPHVS